MNDDNDWIHELLDGAGAMAEDERAQGEDRDRVASYRAALDQLAQSRVAAPDGLDRRILDALPDEPGLGWSRRLRSWWPENGRWLAPAVAGALAVFVATVVTNRMVSLPEPVPAPREVASLEPAEEPGRVAVRFEVRAPAARRVELVGSFNDWRPGEIVLNGPDDSGQWTATVELPAGRHEYLFLVDGKDWVTDPRAAAYRPDGFGRQNALLEL